MATPGNLLASLFVCNKLFAFILNGFFNSSIYFSLHTPLNGVDL